jgi:hypothetical protein
MVQASAFVGEIAGDPPPLLLKAYWPLRVSARPCAMAPIGRRLFHKGAEHALVEAEDH